MRRGAGLVDQQRLGRAADAGAAHLGVHRDGARHVEIGGRVHIDVADAVEMREAPARALPPARARPGSCRRAARSRRWRRRARRASCRPRRGRRCRRSGSPLRRAPPGADRRRAPHGWRGSSSAPSEPPRRITALPDFRQSAAGIGGHIGAALIDHADDAERHAHALDDQAVGPRPGRPSRRRPDRAARRSLRGPRAMASMRVGVSVSRSMKAAARPCVARRLEVVGVGGEDLRLEIAQHGAPWRAARRSSPRSRPAPASPPRPRAARPMARIWRRGPGRSAISRLRHASRSPCQLLFSAMSSRWIISVRPR